jgi:hypothetical protein
MTVERAEQGQYLLPPEPIVYRNELDMYGFSWLLAEYCGLSSPPRSFASWNHGWHFCPSEAPHYNFPGNYLLSPNNIPHVVHRPVCHRHLVEHGFTNVHLGPLPFAFTAPSGLARMRNSLLVVVHHTGTLLHSSELKFIEKIVNIASEFNQVSFCIYDAPEEVLNNNIMQLCAEHGFNVYVGAKREDRNCLPRLRHIYDKHEYMFTNTLGSGILYAAYSGCKVGVAEPPYYGDFFDTCVPRNQFLYAPENFGKWFPNFFVNHPKSARTHYDWAVEEIGAKHQLSAEEIRDILGWSVRGKVNALGRYLARRLF